VNLSSVKSNLAVTLYDQSKLGKAASMQREVLEKTRSIFGEEYFDIISVMGNLAILLHAQGNLDEAIPLFEEIVDKGKRIWGKSQRYLEAMIC